MPGALHWPYVYGLLSLVAFVASALLGVIWWHARREEAALVPAADVAIVLQGDIAGERRSEAVRLCRRLGIPRLWLARDQELPEAAAPPTLRAERIALNFDSTTEEAAYYARRLRQEGIRTAIVVTSAAHCCRADVLFRRALGSPDMCLTVWPAGGGYSLPLLESAKLLLAVLHVDLPIHGSARSRLKRSLASWVH